MQKKILVLGILCVFAYADTSSLIVSHGASYQLNAGITPGAIVTLKGANLTNVIMTAPDPTHPPKSLGGVTVTINDVPCPLYYVSPTQVNLQIDPTITPGSAFVVLQSPTQAVQASTLIEPTSSSGIFSLNGRGSGDGAILNALTYQVGAFSAPSGSAPTYLALFLTSLDKNTKPTVWIGGMSAPVLYYGDQGSYPGMQQINAQLPSTLAGAGRVEVVVEQNGRRSNAVEVVVLPQQAVFPDDQPNQTRSRELAAVAWVPGTSLALVADENDDVVRVIDLNLRRVTHVIALPDGAQPVALGVHSSGKLAIVAERGRDSIALLDLSTFRVASEFPTGSSPSAIAVAGDQAVILNSDSDTASFFTFRGLFGIQALQIVATVPTGRVPRGVAVDSTHAYVTNQSAGTITVIDLVNHTALNTLKLGIDVRPGAIRALPDLGLAVVAEPSAGPDGKLIFVQLANGALTSVSANPDHTGGASNMFAIGDRLYLANQSGGTITTTPVVVAPPVNLQINPVNFKAGAGVRAMDLYSTNNVMLAANEGSGTVALIDLATNSVTGSIDAIRTLLSDNTDDHSDRFAAPNMPSLSSLAPATATSSAAVSNVTITITGTNLTGAYGLLLVDPATVPSLARGKGNVNRGNLGVTDPALVVSNLQVSPDGTKLTAQIQVLANTQPRVRVARVLTPNGETSLTGAPTFSVVPQ